MYPSRLNRRGFLGLAAGAVGAAAGVEGAEKEAAPADAAGAEAVDSAGALPSGKCSFCRELPLARPYDVVVCGGGPSGVAAALAARKVGATVLLLEGQGQFGGNGTSGLVSHWLGGRTSDCRRWVVGGIFRTMAEEATSEGFALTPTPNQGKKYQPHGWYGGQLSAGIPFDPHGMAAYLDRKIAQAEIDFLFFTQAVEVRTEAGRITHVVIFNKSGMAAVPARAVIDATGDADLAARSGCKVSAGRDEDGRMTPASLIFHVNGVDQDALDDSIHEHNSPRFRQKIAALRESGEWDFPYEIFICVQLQEKGTMMINTTRLVDIDGTDGRSVSEGMIRGREEVEKLMRLMQRHFPGFSNVRLKEVAPTLGVRETRRIAGRYVLSVADLHKGKDFDDTIGFSSYGWDLPNPERPSDNPTHGKKRPVTPIPYRVMVPSPVENLICPGRAVSVERPVLGPLRVMAPCMAMGEAAGHAAAMVVAGNLTFAEVDTALLRNTLKEQGAVVDWVEPT